MKKRRRWLASLLALLLCVQFLPLEAMAVDGNSIEVDMTGITAEMGTVTVTAPQGGTKEGDYKVSGLTAGTQKVTLLAVPATGYAFTGWTVNYQGSMGWQDATSMITMFTSLMNAAQLNNAQLEIGISNIPAFQYNLQVVPNFARVFNVTLAVTDHGSIMTAEGTSLQDVAPGSTLTLTAAPEANYTFTGCTLAYEGGQAVPSTDYTLTVSGTTATLVLGEAVNGNITVTPYFVGENDPNFIIPGQTPLVQTQGSGNSEYQVAEISGWNNDTTEQIVITFTEIYANTSVFLRQRNTSYVAADVIFDFGDGKTVTNEETNIANSLSLGDLTGQSEVSFTVRDGRGHEKSGVIKLPTPAPVGNSIEVDMTGITAEMGTVTVTAPQGLSADGDKVSGLTETTQTVTFKAEPAEGYEFGGWKVSYKGQTGTWSELASTMLGVPVFATVTGGATAVNNAELKIGIGSGNYDLKVVPSFTEAVDPDAPNFVVEGQTPTARSMGSSGSEFATATITGWSNNTGETLEIVFERVYGTTTIFLKQSSTAYTAEGVTLDITVNGSEISPTTTATTTSYVLGDITEAIKSGIEFTVKDAAGHEKPGVIKLAAPAASEVKGTVTTANGSVKYDGTTYINGQEITFTAGKSVTLEAVAEENYTLSGWNITANGSPVSASTSGNTVTFTVPDTDFSITANFVQATENPVIAYQIINGPADMTDDSNWTSGGIPISLYRYDDSVSFDEAISDITKRKSLGWDPIAVAAGTNILVQVQQFPGMGRYLTRSVDFSVEVAYEQKEVKSQYSDDITYYYTFKMPNADLTVTHNIAEKALVTVSAKANNEQYGTVVIEPEGTGGYYDEGTQIRLSAVPKDGYTFKEWQETGSSYLSEEQKASNTVQFTLKNTSVDLTAVFEQASSSAAYPIQSEISESGKATILLNDSSMTSAQEGTTITASLSGLDEYYLFDHWEITKNSDNTSLILPADRTDESVTFYMPNDSKGVTVKAVLQERTIAFGWRVFIDGKSTTLAESAPLSIQINGDEVSNGSIKGRHPVKKGDTISFSIQSIHSDYELNEVLLVDEVGGIGQALERYQGTSGTYTLAAWPSGYVYLSVYLLPKTEGYSITLTQPSAGGLIQTSATRAEAGQMVTLTAIPLEGYRLQQWVVQESGGTPVSVAPVSGNENQATFTMPDSDVTVTAEFTSSSTALPTISNVELLHNGSPIGTASLSGTSWTITLPADTDSAIIENIRSQYLRITHTGASVAQQGGTDDANMTYKWANGNVMCNMTLNTPYTFTVRSADGATQVYTITIQYTEGSSGPILTAGTVNRTGDATATVTFTTSASGRYYTSVVAAGAAAPTIDTTGAGVGAVQGSNTISLTNLTTGAKDLYIVVKDESGAVSQPLKVEIPAYSAGMYTITINAPAAGGTIVPNKTTANAGETITLSVVPNTGYQMVAGSLTYTQNVAGSSPVAISNFQFTMPAANVTVTCQWETATTVSGGITSFIINGVSGVINQATGTITVTLPYGTSVNRLTPVIATANVVSLSPSSGTSVNFNRPVTYTARMTDGTIKTYVVTVYVQLGSTADEMWEDLIDFYDQIPWWEYAERQQSRGRYPRYW